MGKTEAKERIKKLKKEIRRHRYLYYVLDDPEISDHVFDSLMHELEKLESDYPDLRTEDSPTQRVGPEPLSHFEKIKHTRKMYSLKDIFGEEEFSDWLKRISKLTKEKFDFFGELKLDGFAVSLTYEEGVLKTGATRGDGSVGEDVTQNLKTISSLPLRLREPNRKEVEGIGLSFDLVEDSLNSSVVEVRGEVFMSKKAFKEINKEQKRRGLSQYANPRNTAAGTIRQLDPKVAANRDLDFMAYDFVTDLGQETHEEKHKLLKLIGFKTDNFAKHLKNKEEVFFLFEEVSKKRNELPWEIDGLVVSVNQEEVYDDLGVVGRSPRGAVALKFPAEQKTTKIQDIIIQVGRTGVLTPIAVLEPVEIRGVTVKRATLHNMDEIERLDVRIGDTIIIERAGDVIPKVVEVIESLRLKKSKKFKVPKECPVCGSFITRDGVYYRCGNKNCPALKRESIYHLVSRGAFNIVGLGPKILDKLYEEGLIRDPADIFSLQQEDLSPLEGLGEKSAENIIKSIKSSKEISLEKFIYSLGILHVGEETAYDLAQHFKNIENIQKASLEDLEKVSDVGEVVAKSIYEWFNNEKNLELLEKFKEKGVKIINPKQKSSNQKLKGLTFVFTGAMKNLSRSEAEELVKDSGGKSSSSVSKNTDYVVIGDNPGSKHDEAKKLDIKIIDENGFKKLVE